MDFTVDGISIVILIAGLVEFAKKFGLRGNGCIVMSAALGVGFGIAYRLQTGLPATFSEWFSVVVFGLALGLVASGLWDIVARRNVG